MPRLALAAILTLTLTACGLMATESAAPAPLVSERISTLSETPSAPTSPAPAETPSESPESPTLSIAASTPTTSTSTPPTTSTEASSQVSSCGDLIAEYENALTDFGYYPRSSLPDSVTAAVAEYTTRLCDSYAFWRALSTPSVRYNEAWERNVLYLDDAYYQFARYYCRQYDEHIQQMDDLATEAYDAGMTVPTMLESYIESDGAAYSFLNNLIYCLQDFKEDHNKECWPQAMTLPEFSECSQTLWN